MAKVTGFLEHDRAESKSIAPKSRLRNFDEFVLPFPEKTLNEQASRCMDCGIPYCHDSCPINNIIPEWNNLCLLYTSPSPRDVHLSRMPSSA